MPEFGLYMIFVLLLFSYIKPNKWYETFAIIIFAMLLTKFCFLCG